VATLPSNPHHTQANPSAWVLRFLPLIPAQGEVLDLACGGGRHTVLLAARGHQVTALDRDTQALEKLSVDARIRPFHGDLEALPPAQSWPFSASQFDAVVVTNYLHRPLFPFIEGCLKPGGVLLYETFADGNAAYGKPSRADFLLKRGELLLVFPGLRVVAFEEGFINQPAPAVVQRLAAVKPGEGDAQTFDTLFSVN
jgi:SAM-dependent methyltransferase